MQIASILRYTWAITLVFTQLLSTSAKADEKPIGALSLPEFARTQVGREAFGLYLAGKKTGFLVTDTHFTTRDGHEALEVESTWTLVMRFLGVESKSELHSRHVYSLDGQGELLYVEERETEDDATIQRVAERHDAGLRVRTTEQGTTTERDAATPRDTLALARELEAWLAQPPRKGDTFTLYEVTLSEEAIDKPTTATFLESTEIVWGGVPIQAHRIEANMEGGKSEMLVADDGRVLRGKLGAILEIRAEEETIARQLDAEPIDMLAASAIQVDQPLGDGETIATLTLRIEGLGDFKLPTNARQQVKSLGDGAAEVTLTWEAEDAPGEALADDARASNLRSTPSLQVDSPKIRGLANEIVGEETDPVRRAHLIVAWIGQHLRPSYAANSSTALAVLERNAGDCTEHALLFTALARAAGIPARQIGGVVYTEEPKPLFAWHAWAEIHDGQRWVTVDPMWQQVRIDPTHIQFSIDSENDSAWMNVLGTLNVHVLGVDRKPQ